MLVTMDNPLCQWKHGLSASTLALHVGTCVPPLATCNFPLTDTKPGDSSYFPTCTRSWWHHLMLCYRLLYSQLSSWASNIACFWGQVCFHMGLCLDLQYYWNPRLIDNEHTWWWCVHLQLVALSISYINCVMIPGFSTPSPPLHPHIQ